MARKSRKKRWSYVCGRKGSTRVRAYEAKRRGPLYVEYYVDTPDGGRKRIRDPVEPRSKELAVECAERKSRELAEGLGGEPLRLGRLLEEFHEARAGAWSERHRKGQLRFRRFWVTALGRDCRIDRLTPARAEAIVARGGEGNAWTGRTQESYLKYLRSAVRWGYRKARLLNRDVLDGVTMPRYESLGEAYTVEELDVISEVAHEIDPRFAGAWELARDTGRRLGAIRTLRVDDLDPHENRNRLAINFPAKSDKARRRGRVFLTQYGRAAVEALQELPEVQDTGWLFPKGRLRYHDDHDGPIGESALLAMLKKAEKLAGVEHLPGRGFHGVKRRVVTELMHALHGDVDRVGLHTGNLEGSVLVGTYRQHDDGLRLETAQLLEERRNGQQTDNYSSRPGSSVGRAADF